MLDLKDESAERTEVPQARLFFAAALPAVVLYVWTLAPTVTSEDSGELITAAYTLGVAHPPGYPLWCLLGKLFTFLPFGTVAWRVNLLSATLGAAAVGVLALIAARFTRSFAVALVSALLFAASRDFWDQCVVAEVYSLNVLLFLLLLYLVLRFEDTHRTRWLYLAAFTWGLGLTNHSTLGPLGPVFFGWVFFRHLELFLRPVLLVNLIAAFLLGFSIVLYIPMRSATDPFIDWGNPETISATIDHLLRRQYSTGVEPRPRTILGQATLVYHFLGTFAAQFTPAVAGVALLGALENRRRERGTFLLLCVLFGLTSYGFIWLLNYPPDRENLHLTRVFFLPANAIGCLWIAIALRTVCRWLGESFLARPRTKAVLLQAAGAGLVLLPLATHFEQNDQSRTYLAEDWGRNILQSLKADSIILPSADHSTFPLLYLQAVEGLRPDVLIGDKYGYIEDRLFRDLFRGNDTPRAAPPMGGTPFEKENYIVEHSGRPVYFTVKSRLPGLDTHGLMTKGLLFQAVKKGEKPDEVEHKKLWESFRFRAGSLERGPGDFGLDLILSDYHYARARYALLFNREAEALDALRAAERYGQGVKEIHNNLGGTLAEAGKPELALPFLRHALSIDPDYDLAVKNTGSALFQLKRYREGLPWFEGALRLDPENPIALLGKARGHKERGEVASAYGAYMAVFRRDPRNQNLREEIEKFAKKAFGEESLLAKLEVPATPGGMSPDDFDDELTAAPHESMSPQLPWAGGHGHAELDPQGGAAFPHGPQLPLDPLQEFRP